MVNKITDNVSPLGEIDKINEVIDQVNTNATAISSIQTTPTSGTNIIVTSAITSPSGYTQTEYLKCDGNQFIDTGWHFSGTFPLRFDCKFVVDSYVGGTGGYPVVYGLQTSGYSNWVYPFYINGGNFNPHIGGSASIDVVPCSLNTTYDTTFIIDNGTWTRTINGVTTSGTWSGTITQDANMFLGGGSYGTNAINQLFGRICSFKITEGNTVVRDYISHQRNTDGVYGMYDFATSTFKASDSPAPFGGGLSVIGTTIGANLPRYVSQFANDRGYITGIDSSMVTTALGYTPYNSTNPSGYITSSALSGYQTTSNLVTSVDSLSDNTHYPGAYLLYTRTYRYINNTSLLTTLPRWYRKWNNLFLEQGGEITISGNTTGSVTFALNYANTNYVVLISSEDISGTTVGGCELGWGNKTKTGFDIHRQNGYSGNQRVSWYACGLGT